MPQSGLKNAIVVLVVVAVVVVIAVLRNNRATPVAGDDSTPIASEATPSAPARLPRMVDLGADKCIPCKQMAPILVELKTEYVGKATIEFIDVWKNPSAGEPYGVRIIPTQIFFDRDGKEVWRHEGFLSRQEIVARLKELGAG
ncbi:MAG: thioredoxin family protein [Phycisphaerae bacterium]